MVRYKKNCTETYTVQTGGLNATLVGKSCADKITTKKYSCNGADCEEDVNGTYDEPTCGGACGGSTVTPAYTDDFEGFEKWVDDNGYTGADKVGGQYWYDIIENGGKTNKEATYANGTWQ